MEGPKAILVSKSSATHGRHQENGPEHICVIPRTHSQLVKFMYGDAHYIPVRERLKGLARRALTARHRKQASDATSMY